MTQLVDDYLTDVDPADEDNIELWQEGTYEDVVEQVKQETLKELDQFLAESD